MPGSKNNPRGINARQMAFLIVLAVFTLVVVIGAGYYILRDTGVVGNRVVGTAALLPTVNAEGTSSSSANTTDTPDDSSVELPPVWTPTTFGISEIDSAQWALQPSDLPLGFNEEPLDGFEAPSDILSEEGGAALVNNFAFAKEGDSPQLVIGITMLVPDPISQAYFDEHMLDPDFLIEEFIDSLDHNGILEHQEMTGLEQIGDASLGVSFVVDMESVEMRIEILTFRRDIAGAMLVGMYIDGFSSDFSIQDLATTLEQRISLSLPASQ